MPGVVQGRLPGRSRDQTDIQIMNSVLWVKRWQDWQNIPGSGNSMCKVPKVESVTHSGNIVQREDSSGQK